MPIPPDTRAPGDGHHVEDHNAISDELTTLAALIPPLATPTEFPGSVGAFNTVGTGTDAARWDHSHSGAAFARALTPTAVKTSAYTAAAGDFVPVDTTSGNVTVTLPSAPADLAVVAVKHVIQGGTNVVTAACGGSDVFNKTGGATSGTLTLLAQGMLLQYKASGGIWYVLADDLPLTQLDGRYPRVATASTYIADQYFESGRPWFDVIAFGADPTGVADSTTAFNNCIAAITGAAAPSSNTRLAKGPMFIPAGTYKITSDLAVTSTQNFVMFGAGAGMTNLKASGTGFTTAVLLIDGSDDGSFRDFQITGDGTEQVTDAIRLDWTTAANRSTTGASFERIRIRALNFVVGVSLEGTGTRQLDGITLRDVVVYGQQTLGSWSTSGNWQKGFALGNGSAGNIYDNWAYGCYASQCYYGWYVDLSSVALYGSEPNGNAIDFWLNPFAQTALHNIQSQNCQRFIVCPNWFSNQPVTVDNVQVKATYLPSGGQVIQITGGPWVISNFTSVAGSFANVISVAGSAANRPGIVTLINPVLNNTLTAGILPTASQAQVLVSNYMQYNAGTGLYTTPTSPLMYYTGSAWTTVGAGPTAADIQDFSSSGTWTKPAGALYHDVILIGPGGGGGSGMQGAASTVRCGGGGGSGGGIVMRRFQAADLTSTVSVTVGTGGGGGAAQATTSTAGNAGSGGSGNTTFGSFATALAGTAGSGGTATAGAGGIAPFSASSGTSASTTGGVGAVQAAAYGGGGGGSGGGITSANAASNGAHGTASQLGTTAVGAAGVVDTTNPTSPSNPTVGATPGGGGGGGAGSLNAPSGSQGPQAGVSGATPGGGGGGGGASVNGNSSGGGGSGANGFARVISYFQ